MKTTREFNPLRNTDAACAARLVVQYANRPLEGLENAHPRATETAVDQIASQMHEQYPEAFESLLPWRANTDLDVFLRDHTQMHIAICDAIVESSKQRVVQVTRRAS